MEYYGGSLGISQAELTDGIMTKSNLDYYKRKGVIRTLRRGCYGTTALYDVETLPTEHRAEVKRRYVDPEAQAKARAFIDIIVIDQIAASYYEGVSIEGARGLSDEKRMLYTNSASILNACHKMLMDAAAEQKKVGKSRRVKMSEFWEARAKDLPRVADIYPHSLPENPRVLQRKYQEYFRGGQPNYEVLISGKFRNKNAARVATPEQVAWLTKFLEHHTNLDGQEVADYYNTVCEAFGWPKVTRRTMLVWLQKLGWLVNAGRHGAKEYMNRYGIGKPRRG